MTDKAKDVENIQEASTDYLSNLIDNDAAKQQGTVQPLGPAKFKQNTSTKFDTKHINRLLGEGNNYVPMDQGALQIQMDAAQSNWERAGASIFSGAVGGIATFIEDLSYVPNIFTQLAGEDWQKNAIAESMGDFKENLYNAMPLYTEDENGMSFWEGVRGVTDSAVGFGLAGGVIGKGVGMLGKGAKATRIIAKMAAKGGNWERTAALVNRMANTQRGFQAMEAIPAGLIMNDLEGTMVGMQIYEDVLAKTGDTQSAAEAATNFKNLNRINAMSDILQVSGLFGAGKATRNILQGQGPMASIKNMGKLSMSNPLLSAVGEGWEEINQGIMTNEVTYRALKENGLSTDDFKSDNVLGRAIDYAFTKEAGFEGLLGLLGGGPQAIITQAVGTMDKKGTADYNTRMENQQTILAGHKERVKKVVQNNANMKAVIENAEIHGEEAQKLLTEANFAPLMAEAFASGTTESLENNLEAIAELTPDQAREAGFSEDYKQVAEANIAELRSKEKLFLDNYYNINRDDIISATLKKELYEKLVGHKQTKEVNAKTSLDKRAAEIAKNYKVSESKKGTKVGEELITEVNPTFDPYNENTSVSPQQAAFNAEVKGTNEYAVFEAAKLSRERDESGLRDINTELDGLHSVSNQSRQEYNAKRGEELDDEISKATTAEQLDEIIAKVGTDKGLELQSKQILQERIIKRQEELIQEEVVRQEQKFTEEETEKRVAQNKEDKAEKKALVKAKEIKKEEERLKRKAASAERYQKQKADKIKAAEDEAIAAEKANTIGGKISKTQTELLETKKTRNEVNKLVKSTKKKLTESNDATDKTVDALLAKIAALEQLLTSNSKKNSKKGKAAQLTINQLKAQIKKELAINQEIFETLNELRKEAFKLKEIEKDLTLKIDYFQKIEQSGKITSARDIQEKINSLRRKRMNVRNLLDKVKHAITNSLSYLNEYVKIFQKRTKVLDTFKTKFNYTAKTIKEINESVENDTEGAILKAAKAAHDILENNVNESIDNIELNEEALAQEEVTKENLEQVLTKLDRQIRFLKELLSISNFDNEEQIAVKKAKLEELERQNQEVQAAQDAANEEAKKLLSEKERAEKEVADKIEKENAEALIQKQKEELSAQAEEERLQLIEQQEQEQLEKLQLDADEKEAAEKEETENPEIAALNARVAELEEKLKANKLTHTEEKSLEAKALIKAQEDAKDMAMTDAKNNSLNSSVDALETESIQGSNKRISIPGQPAPTGLYEKIASSFDVMAFLSRQYNRFVSGDGSVTTIGEKTDDLVEHSINGKLFFNHAILDPKRFPKDTKITLEVDESYVGDIIYNGIPVLWSEFKKGKEGVTAEEIEQHTPIVIKANGEKIAYLHQSDWSTETNLNTEVHTIEENAKMLDTLRKDVITNGKFETTISHKTNGKFFIYADKKARTLTEAMPDPELRIAVAKSADVSEVSYGDRTIQVVNSKLIAGATYVVVPTHDGRQMAIPVGNIKLSEHDDSRNSIAAAIAAYNGTVTAEQQEFVNSMGWDSSTNAGKDTIKEYIGKFVHLVQKGDSKKGMSAEEQGASNRKANNDYITQQDSSRTFIVQDAGKLKIVAGGQTIKASESNENQDELLGKMFLQPSINELGNDTNTIKTISGEKTYKDFVKETTKTRIKSNKLNTDATGGKDVYVYTIQPVVYFDTKGKETTDNSAYDKAFAEAEAKLEEDIAEVNKKREEALKEQKLGTTIIQEDLTNYDKGEESILSQGAKLIKDDIVDAGVNGFLSKEEVRFAQAKMKLWLEKGMSLQEISDRIKAEFGIRASAGRWQLSENKRNTINSEYDAKIAKLEEEFSESGPNKTKTNDNSTDTDGTVEVTEKDSNEAKIAALEKELADPNFPKEFRDAIQAEIKALKGESNGPLTSDKLHSSPISEEQQDAVKDANAEILIEGFDITEQYAATDSIIDIMVSEALKTTDKLSIRKLSVATKDKFKDAIKSRNESIEKAKTMYPEGSFTGKIVVSKLEKDIDNIERILAQYSKLEAFAISRMESIGLVNIKSDGEEVTNLLEKTEFNKDDITRDSRDTVSAEVRRLMHGLTKKNNEGEPQTNYFGFITHENFDSVYAATQALLVNATGDFNLQLDILRNASKKVNGESVSLYPWLSELVTKLEQSNDKMQRQFTISMNQHYNNMSYIQYDVDRDGNYIMTRVNADSASKQRTLLSNWANANKVSGLYTTEGIEYRVNKDARAELLADLENLATDTSLNGESIMAFFSKLGIDIQEPTALNLKDGAFTHNKKKLSYAASFTDASGIFRLLRESINNMDENTTFDQTNIFDQSVIKSLASLDAYYLEDVYATSFTNEGKSISSNSNPKYIVDRINFLKGEKGQKEIERLQELTFSHNSELLKALHSGDGKGTSALLEAFAYDYAAFNPFKKAKSSSFGDSSLSAMSDADHEAYKLALFGSHIAKTGASYTRYLIPTNADKSTSMSMTGVYARAMYKDGKIDKNTMERLYEGLFLPEYNRMLAKMETNIAGFETGKNTFLFIPGFNTIEGLFDSQGVKKMDDTLREKVDAVITEYIESLVEEKEAKWEKAGIGVKQPRLISDSAKDKTFEFILLPEINEIYQQRKGDLRKKVITQEEFNKLVDKIKGSPQKYAVLEPPKFVDKDVMAKAGNSKNLALDMVVNYMMANSNYYQVMVGDISQFYKKDKNLKNDNSIEYYNAVAKTTFDNIIKRLAGEIAPGMSPAKLNKELPKLRYLMLQDRVSKSAAMQLYKDLGLSKKDIKEYEEIEGTDAQEFTTVEEHLDMMLMFGKISEEERTKFLKLANTPKAQLTTEELEEVQTVFQPMKPVYVNSFIDQGILRRLYVKSSSFPLVPALIKNTELETLLDLMVQTKTNRAAFGTAVKVGNTTQKLDVFEKLSSLDENGVQIIENKKEVTHQGTKINGFDSTYDYTPHIVEPPRDAIKIQQEVPYKDKEEINKVTQASKLIFVNMLKEEFNTNALPNKVKNYLKAKNNGSLSTIVTGEALQEAYHDLYRELYENGRNELAAEILDAKGKVNINKLKAIIVKEAKARNMPSNVVNGIINDEDLKFLPYSIHSDKFEALLMSIVNNRVIAQKLPGRSYILGTEEGFAFKTGAEGQEYLNKTEGIIYTDKYSGSLNAVSKKDGKMLPTQVFIQSKFKLNNGSKLDLRAKDADGNWLWLKENDEGTVSIDFNKIDPEVLRIFGMRIPNQGPNSTANMEIAGFLPEGSGDLIIASRDLTKQMGSDFDIDKLYSYQKSAFINSAGKLVVLTAENKNDLVNQRNTKFKEAFEKKGEKSYEDFVEILQGMKDETELSDEYFDMMKALKIKQFNEDNVEATEEEKEKIEKALDNLSKKLDIKVLKNDIIDIHFAVASNPTKGIQAQMATPLGFGYLKTTAENIEGWRENRGKVSSAKFTGLSDQFMKDKYISGSNGGMGTGMYSIDSVFNAMLQGKNVFLTQPGGEAGPVPRLIKFAGRTSNKLSDERTLSGGYTKSDVISWYQSASVDNANENLMGKLNMNSYTMAATRALNQLGFQEETLLLISQDIIYDYINEIANLQSNTNDFMGDAQAEAYEKIKKDYNLGSTAEVTADALTVTKLSEMLEQGETASRYKDHQHAALDFFIEMDLLGTSILKVATSVNTDTKGLGISMIEANMKVNNVAELTGHTGFANIEAVLEKNGVKTINGLATTHGLEFGTKILNQIYPYNSTEVLTIFNKIEELRGTKEKSTYARVKARKDAWKAMKSYKFNTAESKVVEDINSDRKNLMIDIPGVNESLATVIAKIKKTDHAINYNAFFKRLNYNISKNGELSTISINASSREALDEEVIYQAFYSMLVSKNDEVITTVKINGETYDYTYKTLAQDLINYQFVNGLQQGPTDFTKYIPEAYITEATKLKQIAIDGSIGRVDKEAHRTDVHPFIVQYFQHNPYLNLDKEIETEEIDPITHQPIKVKNVFKRGSKKVNNKSVPTLFKLNEQGDYVELPTLGNKSNMEYNGDIGQYNVSVNKYQNPATLAPVRVPVKAKPTSINSKVVANPVKQKLNDEGPYSWNAIKGKRKGNRQDVLNILEEIANGDTSDNNQYLSELILINEHLLPENLTFEINKEGDNEYNWGTNSITLSERSVVVDGRSQEETFLHELVHSFSSTIVNDFNEGKLDKKSAEHKILTSLDKKRNSLISKINAGKIEGLTAEGLKEVTDFQIAMELLNAGKKVDNIPTKPSTDMFNKYYGFVNLKEFMTMSTSNPTFREQLNGIKRADGASWIQKIVDEVMEFFGEILGITKENSELRAVMEDIILFVQRDANSLNEATQGDMIVINSKIDSMVKEGVIEKDCSGKLTAKNGMTNATKGTGWKMVKDFQGQPKHSQGGVDISISNKGVSMRRGSSDIKAAHGLLIPTEDEVLKKTTITDDNKTVPIQGSGGIPSSGGNVITDFIENNAGNLLEGKGAIDVLNNPSKYTSEEFRKAAGYLGNLYATEDPNDNRPIIITPGLRGTK